MMWVVETGRIVETWDAASLPETTGSPEPKKIRNTQISPIIPAHHIQPFTH